MVVKTTDFPFTEDLRLPVISTPRFRNAVWVLVVIQISINSHFRDITITARAFKTGAAVLPVVCIPSHVGQWRGFPLIYKKVE